MMKVVFLASAFLSGFLAATEIPLAGWSSGAEVRKCPAGKVPALFPGKRGIYSSPRISVEPSARYRLSFRYYSEQSNLFYLEIGEYDAQGVKLPRTDWKRHRDSFLRPDRSLRKVMLEMTLPFDTQPECASVSIEIEKISPAALWLRDFQLESVSGRPALAPEPFSKPDNLSMMGPDGILYPDFTRAGVSERRPPTVLFPVRKSGSQADAAAGIQAAVDAAARAGGGIVALEEGEYLLYGKVYVTSDRIVVRGAGRGKTRLISQPLPSGLQMMNFAPGDRIGKNTKLELYFPWKECASVVLSIPGRELGRWEIPASAEAEKFDSTEAYLKFLNLRKDRGFSVCPSDPAVGKIALPPESYVASLPAGKCRMTLEVTGRDGAKRTAESEFFVTAAHYSTEHSLLHFEGSEYTAAASRMPLAGDVTRGGTKIELAADHRLNEKSEFLFLNAPLGTRWDEEAHTPLAWGRMRRSAFRIAGREGKSITLATPSRLPFLAEEGSFATAFFPIRFSGVEQLTVEQRGELQKEFKLNAIAFRQAADCEVREVEVVKAGVWPVQFTNAINCTFSDSVLRGAHFPRSLLSYAGFEYGTDCLMERIETFDLRHAPLLNWACSGCVIRDSVFHNSDAQLHSGYCMENLFEQCKIVETTGEFSSYGFAFYSTPFNDGMHGSCGPRNVIYNCDMRSRKSAIYLGGNNFQWRIAGSRFEVDSGPGIIARLNCRDNIIANNVFTLKSAKWPLLFNEYMANSGNVITGNTIIGGNGEAWGGVKADFKAEDNRFLPAGTEAPEVKVAVPSLYLWQKSQKSSP